MSASDETQQNGDLVEQRLRELEEQLQKKETELENRDRTVRELTDRLSQTVERLDRVKRAGSDQNVIRTAAFPKEVVEQQTELVEDLQRAVEMWQNMQLSCSMGRFEMQLSDLHALFEEHFRPPEPEPDPEAETEEAELNEETADEETPEAEAIKESSEEEPIAEVADIDEMCPLRPPEILNLGEADEEALRRCVEQQDDYIDYLSARLQRVAEKKTAVDWDELAKDPEKIEHQLEYTMTKIQQSQHFAEFELALQRTRLKRKERDLKLLSEVLEAEMKKVDLGKSPSEVDEPAKGQRWLRMLGVNKNE